MNKEKNKKTEREERRVKRKEKREEVKQDKVSKTDEKRKNDPAYSVMLQNLSLYFVFRKLIAVSVFVTISLFIAIISTIGYTTEETEPKYIHVDEKGRVIKDYPLNEEGEILEGDITSNAIEVVNILNTYDYINWKKQIKRAEKYFIPNSWVEYQNKLDKSETLKTVENEESIVNVEINDVPTFNKRLANGIMFWKVVIPITIRYKPHNKEINRTIIQKGEAELYYRRVSLNDNPRQYAITVYRFNVKSSY